MLAGVAASLPSSPSSSPHFVHYMRVGSSSGFSLLSYPALFTLPFPSILPPFPAFIPATISPSLPYGIDHDCKIRNHQVRRVHRFTPKSPKSSMRYFTSGFSALTGAPALSFHPMRAR